MEILIDDKEINLKNLHITKYENFFNQNLERVKEIEIDFKSISSLKGNKKLLELAFQAEKKEQLI